MHCSKHPVAHARSNAWSIALGVIQLVGGGVAIP